MTRDEAINTVEALQLKDPNEPNGARDGGVRNLIDTLAALGVLKLDTTSDLVVVDTEREKGRKAAEAGFLRGNNPHDERVYGAFSVDETIRQERAAAWYAGFDSYSKPRCEPPPEHRGKRWHWLHVRRALEPPSLNVGRWEGDHWTINCDLDEYSPAELAQLCWRYIAPCEEPEQEVGDSRPILEPGTLVWVARDDDQPALVGRFGRVHTVEYDGWVLVQIERVVGLRRFRAEHLSLTPPTSSSGVVPLREEGRLKP